MDNSSHSGLAGHFISLKQGGCISLETRFAWCFECTTLIMYMQKLKEANVLMVNLNASLCSVFLNTEFNIFRDIWRSIVSNIYNISYIGGHIKHIGVYASHKLLFGLLLQIHLIDCRKSMDNSHAGPAGNWWYTKSKHVFSTPKYWIQYIQRYTCAGCCREIMSNSHLIVISFVGSDGGMRGRWVTPTTSRRTRTISPWCKESSSRRQESSLTAVGRCILCSRHSFWTFLVQFCHHHVFE